MCTVSAPRDAPPSRRRQLDFDFASGTSRDCTNSIMCHKPECCGLLSASIDAAPRNNYRNSRCSEGGGAGCFVSSPVSKGLKSFAHIVRYGVGFLQNRLRQHFAQLLLRVSCFVWGTDKPAHRICCFDSNTDGTCDRLRVWANLILRNKPT